MGRYAKTTKVDTSKSRMEIEKVLVKYGAHSFVSGWQDNIATIMFDMNDRRVKFLLRMPDKDSREFVYTPNTCKRRTPKQAHELWEQGCRQVWRALLLIVKAKLEAVESGVTTFEDEFLAHLVIPGRGSTTVGELVQLNPNILNGGQLPPLLGGGHA